MCAATAWTRLTLQIFEQWWARWYMYIGDPVLATGIMSFLMHEVRADPLDAADRQIVYFGRCIPWIIIGRIRYFDQWKLQEDKIPTAREQWECTKYVLYTHFTIELPQIWGFHPLAEALGMSTHQVPFPHWTTMAYQIVIFFFFEDFFRAPRISSPRLTAQTTGRTVRCTRARSTSASTSCITSSRRRSVSRPSTRTRSRSSSSAWAPSADRCCGRS